MLFRGQDTEARKQAGTLDQSVQLVTQNSSPEAKIELFRSLFRGRTDVFPVRFESRKTGKGGYSPACENEWVRGVCEKPRIKCPDCPNRRFIPVTDDIIRYHLPGRDNQGRDFVMGVRCECSTGVCKRDVATVSVAAGESTGNPHRVVQRPGSCAGGQNGTERTRTSHRTGEAN